MFFQIVFRLFVMLTGLVSLVVLAQSETKEQAVNSQSIDTSLDVRFLGIDEKSLIDNIHAYVDLYKYRDKGVTNPSYTQFLINSGKRQIAEALRPYGYYLPKISVSIDKSDQVWAVTYQIKKGPPVEIENTKITLTGEGLLNEDLLSQFKKFPLSKGEKLLQPEYEKYKNDLQKAALEQGFFNAKFDKKEIKLADSLEQANIVLEYDSGQRFEFGKVTIEQDFLDEDVFERFKTFHQGQPYAAKSIADMQRGIYNSGYVKVIDIKADPNKKTATVPVNFKMVPNKNKVHTFRVGYGTDSGVRAGYDFDWRWVNRRGHKLNYDAFISQTQSKMGVNYQIPAKYAATDSYNLYSNIKRNDRNGRRFTAMRLGGEYRDKRNHLDRAFGLALFRENFRVGETRGSTSLLTPTVRLKYRQVDDDLSIKKGVLVEGEFTGAYENLLSDVSFAQANVKAHYLNHFDKKHKIKLFGGLGATWVDTFEELPVSYRFFTGGDKTVRGYEFERIGEEDENGNVIGGDKLIEVSAEYEYFLKDNLALAAFVDAGDAYISGSPKLHVGAGVGIHYYLPIGPVRLDFAHGFNDKGDSIRVHLNIGPEF